MKLFLAFSLSIFITNVLARPMCKGGAELPGEQILDQTGLGEMMNAIQNSDLNFDPDTLKAVCESLCVHNLSIYKDGVIELMDGASGSTDEKYKSFHKNYIFNPKLVCPKLTVLNGTTGCSHAGESIVRTAVNDFDDPIVKEIINNGNIDFFAIDGKQSTIEWIREKCSKGPWPTQYSKTYYCNVQHLIECKAYSQQPTTYTGSKPTNCGI